MDSSINGTLLKLANEYYISYGSTEQKKIDASVARIQTNLKNYFNSRVTKIIEFGSYKRDTILPRKYDEHSDVDLMVVFSHNTIGVTPGTYRNYLVDFSNAKYNRSEVYKSSPTVVLELDHIKYDLVPAYEQIWNLMIPPTTYIPANDSTWMTTDPNGFNGELTRKNNACASNIKKVIRLLKGWNAKVGYPLESFALEQEITRQVYIYCNSLQDYFFSAVAGMSGYRFNNSFAEQKIKSLKDNLTRVKDYLRQNDQNGALTWLAHILPM